MTSNELLTETEEQRVHTHGVDAEEAMSDEVGAQHHSLGRTETVNPHFTRHTKSNVMDHRHRTGGQLDHNESTSRLTRMGTQ